MQRRKYCMELGTAFVMTSHGTSAGFIEETTSITDKEEAVATTVKRVYLTPKLVFNNKVEPFEDFSKRRRSSRSITHFVCHVQTKIVFSQDIIVTAGN